MAGKKVYEGVYAVGPRDNNRPAESVMVQATVVAEVDEFCGANVQLKSRAGDVLNVQGMEAIGALILQLKAAHEALLKANVRHVSQ